MPFLCDKYFTRYDKGLILKPILHDSKLWTPAQLKFLAFLEENVSLIVLISCLQGGTFDGRWFKSLVGRVFLIGIIVCHHTYDFIKYRNKFWFGFVLLLIYCPLGKYHIKPLIILQCNLSNISCSVECWTFLKSWTLENWFIS